MEIFLFFVLFSVFVLGILSLIVLEYQNQRAKQWQQPLTPATPPSQYTDTSQVASNPKVYTHIAVPTPQAAYNFNQQNDTVFTGV
ncbi:MAG: hypothetical protein HN521_10255 [Candidatus Latescibacteria bacterium]|nr:hypothetical protein [Candidatus Latescibacterota bacterium]